MATKFAAISHSSKASSSSFLSIGGRSQTERCCASEGHPCFGTVPPAASQIKPSRVKVTLDLNEQMKTEMANKLMALKIRPIGDRILVQAVDEGPEKNTRGSIIIPETAKGKPMEGVVIAVGVGKIGEDGKKLFLEIKR